MLKEVKYAQMSTCQQLHVCHDFLPEKINRGADRHLTDLQMLGEESGACCLVMNCGMMFCPVVAIVFFAWGPVVSKLSSTFSVVEPMVLHVHCFQFLDDIVVGDAECSGVVRLHWCQRLGMAHEFKGMAGKDGLSAVDVESFHLSLCCQGHDHLESVRL
jgi:hypothetical protein